MSARARVSPAQLRASGRVLAAGLVVALLGLVGARSIGYLGFIALALLPTLAAAILERTGQRVATVSIGSMTVATLLPLVMDAIANGAHRDLLTSSAAWMFVGGAVAGGIAIYFALPAATVWMDNARAGARLRWIRAQQAQLERDWGAEVRNDQPQAAPVAPPSNAG